jgi:hypothetical protein
MKLIADAQLPWEGELPYARLAQQLARRGRPPITPDSTAAEVKDAFFDLMDGNFEQADRAAWDELRLPATRLVVDFFHYPLPDDAGNPSLDALSSVPLPLHLPPMEEIAPIDGDPVNLPAAPQAEILNLGAVPIDVAALYEKRGTDD